MVIARSAREKGVGSWEQRVGSSCFWGADIVRENQRLFVFWRVIPAIRKLFPIPYLLFSVPYYLYFN